VTTQPTQPEARPRFARGTSSFYIAARDAYVSRASRLVVRRPKTILGAVFFMCDSAFSFRGRVDAVTLASMASSSTPSTRR